MVYKMENYQRFFCDISRDFTAVCLCQRAFVFDVLGVIDAGLAIEADHRWAVCTACALLGVTLSVEAVRSHPGLDLVGLKIRLIESWLGLFLEWG